MLIVSRVVHQVVYQITRGLGNDATILRHHEVPYWLDEFPVFPAASLAYSAATAISASAHLLWASAASSKIAARLAAGVCGRLSAPSLSTAPLARGQSTGFLRPRVGC